MTEQDLYVNKMMNSSFCSTLNRLTNITGTRRWSTTSVLISSSRFMKMKGKFCGSYWQLVTIALLVLMFTVNIRVLGPWMSRQSDLRGSEENHECREKLEVHIRSRTNVSSFSMSQSSLVSPLNSDFISVLGVQRKDKGFLTIGIPSIKRINGITYLMQTLDSIDQEISADEKLRNCVIVFLADFDGEYNNRTIAEIRQKYTRHLETGFIQVLQVSRDYYPPLENLKRNFNDEPQRVTWRAKQVMDYALMFRYSRDLSSYYLQLEDDVQCGKHFISGIQQFIDLKTREGTWAMLEFSELGFIGKVFKSSDLEKLASFMTMFYEEQPVDWLMTYFRLSMGQQKVFLRKPTLFQHVGLKSSFDITKDNKLKDRYFESGDKPWVGDNPPATVLSSMPPFESNTADLAYSSGSGYFWAAKVELGDAIFVIFEQPQMISKIAVETGYVKHKDDVLHNGTVFIGSAVGQLSLTQPDQICSDLTPVSDFTNGRMLAEFSIPRTAKCVKILVTESQTNWVVFYQIAVFLAK